jgi:hypothetical protein
MIDLGWYRTAVVCASVALFFTNFEDFSQRWGFIPLQWIFLLAALTVPLAIPALMKARLHLTPLVFWAAGYVLITIAWYYPSKQTGEAFRDVRLRVLSMLFLCLMLFLLSRPEEQRTARVGIALAVLLAVGLNLYDLFNPLTFSTIPGRSSGLYQNVNQSGAALMLGMIIAYEVVPRRLRTPFVMVTAIGIITTFSRAAILGWILVVLYYAVRGGFGVAQLRRIFVLCIVVFSFIVSPFWGDLQHTLEERGTLTPDVVQRLNFINGDTSDASSQEREGVAKFAWRHFEERPLTGFGTGEHRQLEGYLVGTHNVYLAMMVDHGILGLFVLPLLILAALWGLRPAQYDLALPFAMFLSMWGFFSHNVLEERYILVAVALVGSIVASHRVRVEEPQRVAAPVVVSLGMSI